MNQRLFRFVQWNDVHVTAPPTPGTYLDSNRRAVWLRELTRGGSDSNGFQRPDFVASVGDLVNTIAEDEWVEHIEAYLKPLGLPVLPCVGNHENRAGKDYRSYDRFFGKAWRDYCYTYGGIGFVVVDSSPSNDKTDMNGPQRAAFFDRAMAHLAGWPIIVITHLPTQILRDPATLEASFKFGTHYQRDTTMRDRVNAHADRVIAVLSGHVHLSAVRWVNGIVHIMPCGTAGYPGDIADFDVYADHIEVRVHAVPADLFTDQRRADLHGQPRHPIDYTDADHPTHEAYIRGNADERAFTIPLNGKKRPQPDAERKLCIWHESEPGQWRQAKPLW